MFNPSKSCQFHNILSAIFWKNRASRSSEKSRLNKIEKDLRMFDYAQSNTLQTRFSPQNRISTSKFSFGQSSFWLISYLTFSEIKTHNDWILLENNQIQSRGSITHKTLFLKNLLKIAEALRFEQRIFWLYPMNSMIGTFEL